MIEYTLPLAQTKATIEMVGGKGMSLSKLLTAGISVPDGFHVTTASYRLFVEINHIQPYINKMLEEIHFTDSAQLEAASAQIGLLFHRGKMPEEVTAAIQSAYAGLGSIPVAVRSSATAEDLPEASFAGQQDTYLNILGESQVLDAVKRCWASLWTARAIAYRMKNNIKQEQVSIAMEKDKLYIVQARPITVLPPEWVLPEKDVIYTKGSLAEHLPNPVTPLFSTLGLGIINRASALLWADMFDKSAKKLLPRNGAYTVINGYVYLSAKSKPLLIAAKSLSPRALRKTLTNSIPRWKAAGKEFSTVVKEWEEKPLHGMSAHQLMEGIQSVFFAACTYFTRIQLTLPAASLSEALFTKLFTGTVRRAGITNTSVFLLGFDTISLQSEKNLWKISEWAKKNNSLNHYLQNNSTINIERDTMSPAVPAGVIEEVWGEWKNRINLYFKEYGRTAYEFDFSYPTPQEMLTPTLESIKSFMEGKGDSPFLRQSVYEKQRKQAEDATLKLIDGTRKKLFLKLLNWAQETAPMREDAIYLMGLGHPLIRSMFREISKRLMGGGAILQMDDIYWLTKSELDALVIQLDKNMLLTDLKGVIPARKAEFKKFQGYVPPSRLPEKNENTLLHVPQNRKDGKIILKGIGTSTGVVTAPACVVHSPADFEGFKPGSVLIAVTTTPAWTPLFSLASAIVTDIGGPLSHSSIVAREYGIPAVMAAHNATRTIQSGQMITVDGAAGKVTISG